MKVDPLVSVVIPAFNRANSIRATLQSVQEQTYRNWEAVVIDDGSTDGTAEAVTRLASRDSRVRLIRQDLNKGAQAARNAGILAARGKWVSFLDSDDQFLPESLELRLNLAIREHLQVVHSECNVVRENEGIRPYGVKQIAGEAYKKLLKNQGPVFGAILVSKEALKKINYLDEKIVSFQEWDTMIRLGKYYRFGFVDRPTFTYDCRNSDTISKQMLRGGTGYEQVMRKHYLPILWYAGPAALAHHYRVAASWYEAGGDRQAAQCCRLMSFFWLSLDLRTVRRRVSRSIRRLS